MTRKLKIDIIGAGISGLSTAYYLNRLNRNLLIRVWEKESGPGGLAGNFRTESFSVEKFYHHIFKRDKALQNLIIELGLGNDLKWRRALTGTYYFKQPFRLSSPIDLLRFKPLPIFDRLRFGLMLLHARKVKNWKKLDDISAKEYIIKYGSENIYRIIWEPLFKGKFGRYADDISAAWLWSKIIDRGGSRNKRGVEYLGYLKGGLGRVFTKLVEVLRADGHSVFFNNPITEIELEKDRHVVGIHTKTERIENNLVVSCTQLPNLVDILPDSCKEYKNSLSKIKFLGNVCLVLILSKSLSEFYWTNVTDSETPFVGIVEHTNWADIEDFKNTHLIYISAYLPPEDNRIYMKSEELLDYYLPYVRKIFPNFDRSIVIESFKWYEPHAQPVVHTGYRNSIPEIQSPIDNLLLCTMAQIYPHDRQVSNGIDIAIRTVNIIREKFLN